VNTGILTAILLLICRTVRWAAWVAIHVGQVLIRKAYGWLAWSERQVRP
jgi:hypothetical protein